MSLTTNSQFFDINSDEAFFLSLQRAASKLQSLKVKETANVLYLLMGVNHLRDWIAPGYDRRWKIPTTPAQKFYVAIYSLPEFKVINVLCNRSKHMGDLVYCLEAKYGTMIDEYLEIDSVFDFDNGPPIGYSVDGRDLFDIIAVVLRYYQSEWYEKQHRPVNSNNRWINSHRAITKYKYHENNFAQAIGNIKKLLPKRTWVGFARFWSGTYTEPETLSRAEKRGLWADSDSIPPWEGRHIRWENPVVTRFSRNTLTWH